MLFISSIREDNIVNIKEAEYLIFIDEKTEFFWYER
jgi:hypothetical protein